jgi:hypothetical protein
MAVVILTLSCGLSIKHLPVTPVRLRLHKNSNRWLFPEKRNGGHWDNRITVACPWCSQRFSISEKILDVISTINHNAHLYPDQSPCLELPDEAWEEPKLLSECPFCHKPLKFNPFIVDNRGRY